MADIKIYDLEIAGTELFADTENYLADMSEEELNFQGGLAFVPILIASSEACAIGVAGVIATVSRRLL